jgi:hypothetical protein
LPTTENEKSGLFVIHQLIAVCLCVADIQIMDFCHYGNYKTCRAPVKPGHSPATSFNIKFL